MKEENPLFEDVEEVYDDKFSNEEEQVTIPREVRKISTQAYDKSVWDIVRMINDHDINMNPEYQRNYIWDNKKASLLIESIILNVPIPVIYVSQEEDDSWTVIDGLQRLNSLKRFFDRDFKLSGLEILNELNKLDCKGLNPTALRMLKNGLLRIIVISHDSNEEIKYDVFMRLNRGSIKLNEQELRNCLFRGSLNDLLKKLSENKIFLLMQNIESPHKRMNDCELILRFLALGNNWGPGEEEVKDYKGRMKNYMNDFMSINQHASVIRIADYEKLFNDTINKVHNVFGDKAFKRVNEKGEFESSFNRAIMDSLMVSFMHFDEKVLIEKSAQIKDKFIILMNEDKFFKDSITIGTSDKKVLAYRLTRWFNELNAIINGKA